MSQPPGRRKSARAKRLAVRLAAVALCSAVLLEGSVRLLVLPRATAGWPLAAALRSPSNFGRASADDLHWEMRFRARPVDRQVDYTRFDPQLGSTSRRVQPESLVHEREGELEGRRPVLLFGDSFADGMPSLHGVADFGSLFERSPLAGEYALLNYGNAGSALDQTLLTMRKALERHADARPIVVPSLLVDDDIDRCLLSFRGSTKPRFHLREGRLELQHDEVPRVAEHFEQHATRPASWAWRMLTRALDPARDAPGSARQEREKQELGRAILRAMVDELRARELPFVFLLFHQQSSIADPAQSGWREALVIEVLDQLEAPWVSVRPSFQALLESRELELRDTFLHAGNEAGHHNALGNAVAFQALLDGLQQHLSLGPGGDVAGLCVPRLRSLSPAPGAAGVGLSTHVQALAERGLEGPYVVLDPSAVPEVQAGWDLGGCGGSISARVSLVGRALGADVRAELVCSVDGRELARLELQSGAPPVPLELDLATADRLTLQARTGPGSPATMRLVLDRFELHD